MTRKQILLSGVILAGLLALAGLAYPIQGQAPTDTPPPTETLTETPTGTPTITATPNVVLYATITPGQDSQVLYTITAGQVAIFSLLALIAILLTVCIYAILRTNE